MKRKILAVCNGGNVRSVALAEALKGTYGCESIAASTYWLSHETMNMLCRWADEIWPVDVLSEDNLPEPDRTRWRASPMWDTKYDLQRRVFQIGVDKYGNAQHPDLRAFIREKISREKWL